jgi:hypothetical protein
VGCGKSEETLSLNHIDTRVGLSRSMSADAPLDRWVKMNVGKDPSLADIAQEAGL